MLGLPPASIVRLLLRPVLLTVALLTLTGAPAYASGRCGDADGNDIVSAVDALAALRSAVGLESPCDGNCDCDTDGNRELSTSDALDILRSAIGGDSGNGCGFIDECFKDEDCENGFECGTDPDWSCDAACVPGPTTTTEVIGDECFEDFDCWDDYPGWHCGGSTGNICVECHGQAHCDTGFACAGYVCVPE